MEDRGDFALSYLANRAGSGRGRSTRSTRMAYFNVVYPNM